MKPAYPERQGGAAFLLLWQDVAISKERVFSMLGPQKTARSWL
jgi:hypothetical protein